MTTMNAESKKHPLDSHLVSGPKGTADDVRVQTGYPIWNLIDLWVASGYRDEVIFEGYSDMPREEWEAAKRYYLDHKPFIDARIVTNSQPLADDAVLRFTTADEYFAYLVHQGSLDRANVTNDEDATSGEGSQQSAAGLR